MNRPGQGPQQLRPSVVNCTEDDARRTHILIVRCGSIRRAAKILGVGEPTFDAARDFGRMLKTTRARILEGLDREGIT